MRVVCPGCDAVYEVPNAVLNGPPRMLRCARCAREWVPQEPASPAAAVAEPAAPQAAPPEPAPIAFRDPPPEPPPDRSPPLAASAPLVERPTRRPASAALVGWTATLVFLAALLSAAYVWRAVIQTAWPPIQRAYAGLGLS